MITSLRAVSSPSLPCDSSTRVCKPQIPLPSHVGLQWPYSPQKPQAVLIPSIHSQSRGPYLSLKKKKDNIVINM
jgi:hypothetical protein